MTDRRIADWLVASRESQIDAETGEPWTQPHFLAELEAATGWKLHRSNLSAYENGRQLPKGKTLAKFVEFWKTRGVGGPDLSPPSRVQSDQENLASAIRALTEELRLLREGQATAGAATARLVEVAIRETLQAVRLLPEPPAA